MLISTFEYRNHDGKKKLFLCWCVCMLCGVHQGKIANKMLREIGSQGSAVLLLKAHLLFHGHRNLESKIAEKYILKSYFF